MPTPEPASRPWGAWHLVPLAVAAAAGTFVVLVTLRHGLDWTDESFVWAMIASDRVAVGEAWGFQHLLHPVFTVVGESVLSMRVLRVLGYLGVSAALTWAASRALRAAGIALSRREQWFVFLVAQAGSLLAWSYPPRYLGYNELSAWLSSLICAALAVGLLPLDRDGRWSRVLPWVSTGLLLAPLVLAKFTAAVAWAVIVVLVLLVPVPGTPRWLRLVAVGAGAFVSTVGMSPTGAPVATVVRNSVRLLRDPSAQQESSHSIPQILQTYLRSTQDTAQAVVVPVLLLVGMALLCLLHRRRSVLSGITGTLLGVASVAVLLGPAIEGSLPACC